MQPQISAFTVTPRSFHELVIMPQFADVLNEKGEISQPSNDDGDWAVMDDVSVSRPIIDLFGNQNILKRRDATCKLVYSPVGKMSAREIRTEKIYAATEDCQEEFYQGAFEDWSSGNYQIFGEQIMPLLAKGIQTDLYTNKYFGDVSRASDATGKWSWNKFDGIFTKINEYIASGIIPAAQTFSVPSGALTPQQARDSLASAYARQDGILKVAERADKCFYVDQNLADAYWDWLVYAGHNEIGDRQAGRPAMYFKGIEIKEKKWDGVLQALNNGTETHVVLLTLRANFLYATDKSYGGGGKRDQAVRVWFSEDDQVWRRQVHMKAGTQIIAPQHIVIGMTEWFSDSN